MQTVATPDDQLWSDNNGQGQRGTGYGKGGRWAGMELGCIKNAQHFDFQNGRRPARQLWSAWGCAKVVAGTGTKVWQSLPKSLWATERLIAAFGRIPFACQTFASHMSDGRLNDAISSHLVMASASWLLCRRRHRRRYCILKFCAHLNNWLAVKFVHITHIYRHFQVV